MFYLEYAVAARTHYKSCKFLYDNCIVDGKIKDGGTADILYRLYYLCGHIIECASVFLIYDYFKWNENNDDQKWRGEKQDINKGYNKKFTMASHMHFYPLKVDPETKKILYDYQKSTVYFGTAGPNESFYNVHSHGFQEYIKGIIWAQLPQNVPYLRPTCPEDYEYKSAIDLIESWSTDLRYYYEGRMSGSFVKNQCNTPVTVTVQNISELFRLCERIITIIPSGKTL